MRPVFAGSASVRAPEALMLRGGRWRSTTLAVRYGLFMHPQAGPVLIDTGYGPMVCTAPGRSAALRLYSGVLRPVLKPEGQVPAFLARHGLRPEEVGTVIVTHFHADHISELKALPRARFLADRATWQRLADGGVRHALRHGVFRELLPGDFAARLDDIGARPRRLAPAGLGEGRDLFGDGTVLAVPLPGHAVGHFGLCFVSDGPPLLYAVDVQWLDLALDESRAPGGPARWFVPDAAAMHRSAQRVLEFRRAGGLVQLCHDPHAGPFDEGGGL